MNKKEIQWLLREKYHNRPNKHFDKDVERLKAGEPLDYVIGFTEFLNCKIDLSERPLIPRPETEFWVEKVLPSIKKNSRILDIFAGSGCIGLSIVRHSKGSNVTFADIDKKAIDQVKLNCKINRISGKRYSTIRSDMFSKIKGKFDYIFANPPYIPNSKQHKIQKTVLMYEPSQALFGGGDGMFYIKKLLAEGKKYLTEGGCIFAEFDPPQKKTITKLVKKNGYQAVDFHKDQFGKWRYFMVK